MNNHYTFGAAKQKIVILEYATCSVHFQEQAYTEEVWRPQTGMARSGNGGLHKTIQFCQSVGQDHFDMSLFTIATKSTFNWILLSRPDKMPEHLSRFLESKRWTNTDKLSLRRLCTHSKDSLAH